MDHYKTLVMDYLQADPAVFVNTECSTQLDEHLAPDCPACHFSCDAVAIDLRHGVVYLCLASFDDKLQGMVEQMSTWTRNWDSIKTSLCHGSKVPKNWRVYVWLFVPKDSIEMLDEELERLRQTAGSKFKVKITALEDVQPWRASSWKRCEETWETAGRVISI